MTLYDSSTTVAIKIGCMMKFNEILTILKFIIKVQQIFGNIPFSSLFLCIDVIPAVGVVFWNVKSVILKDNLSATSSLLLLGQHTRMTILWRGLPCLTS